MGPDVRRVYLTAVAGKGRTAENPDHLSPDLQLSLGGEEMAQLVKYFPGKHKDLRFNHNIKKKRLDMGHRSLIPAWGRV